MLDPDASIVDGKLVVNEWDGVAIGHLPELGGATSVLLRFEDVTFTKHVTDPDSGATSNFTVLTGDDMNWWAAVHFDLTPFGSRTTLSFDLDGFSWTGPSLDVVVAEEVVDHFDSIEYRFDGLAPDDQRLAVRWNDGPWVMGGQSDEPLTTFPPGVHVRINNGAPADWDPMWGSLGPISFSSNQVPEPSGVLLLLLALTGLLIHRRTA